MKSGCRNSSVAFDRGPVAAWLYLPAPSMDYTRAPFGPRKRCVHSLLSFYDTPLAKSHFTRKGTLTKPFSR